MPAWKSGIPPTEDYNAAQYEGVSYLQLSTTATARRCSTAVGYLRKARGRPNLEIRTHVQVQHLQFTGNRVSGVAYRPIDDNGGPKPPLTDVQAEAEVIVCAGAINSPHILELSGIGDTKSARAGGHSCQPAFARCRRKFDRSLASSYDLRVFAANNVERCPAQSVARRRNSNDNTRCFGVV